MTDNPPLSDSERLRILSEAMREAVDVYLRYIDPANGISRDDALNHLVAILDRRAVAEAAGIELGPPRQPKPHLRIVT